MSPTLFVKHYADPARGNTAREHWRWLSSLDSGVRLPRLHPGAGDHLVFEHLHGRQPRPADLGHLAATLGRLHAAAYRQLHAARLDRPHTTADGLVIGDFVTPRQAVLDTIAVDLTALPAAVYKDANIRNFLITDDGPAVVDFDDLTLAPFGYDLAKLIVTAAMTHGPVPARDIATALNAYNARAAAGAGCATDCPPDQFRLFAEMHHVLTARYLHRNGYQHPWPDVRPWPAPPMTPVNVKEHSWPSPPN